MNVVINGLGTANDENVTGIQRVCRELTLRLDELLKNEPEIHAEYLSKTGAKTSSWRRPICITSNFANWTGRKTRSTPCSVFPGT